ncbi:DMT family transporter [Roseivirga pacifica]|uniref:DMT family transporter n=1 Tax=Roseivirga pacifica TaxID=1267423 RepID=UPI00227ADC08|nr:DMT family transporter [Roseivirga pacifica]
MKNTNVLAWGILAILALIWGSSFILIKRGLEVFGPGEVGAVRILAACLFLVPVSIPRLRKLSPRHIKLLFLIGLVGTFFPAFLFAIGQTRLDSGITGVLNGLTPIFTLIIGGLFFQQKFTKHNYIGLILAFVGTVVLLTAGSGGDISEFNYYAFFIVLATLCYGTNLNVIKRYLADLNPVVITSVSILLVGPFAGIYLLTATDFETKLATAEGAWRALGYVSLLGVMGTALALILFNKLVQITTPIFSSTVTYLIPIVALTWGILDGETLILGQMIGIASILVGVFITNRKKKMEAKTNSPRNSQA